MKSKSNVEIFWQEYLDSLFDPVEAQGRFYEVFRTGHTRESANSGAQLVLAGIKTCTSSLLWEYELSNRNPPQIGSLSILQNGEGDPVCIIETTRIVIKEFSKIDAKFAYDYGQWDRTLKAWRANCWEYYSEQCQQLGRVPLPQMRLVCEWFEVVYPVPKTD